MKPILIGLLVVFASGCVTVPSAETKQDVTYYDAFGRELLFNPAIPLCSKVTLKKDVKECRGR